MCSNDVFKAILGTVVVTAAIGEKHGGATHAEETVGNEHRPITSRVPIISHRLGAHHHSIVVGICLKHVPSQINGYDPSAAAHATQVVAQNVAPHFVVVYDHGGQGGCGIEYAAVHHKNTYVLGTDLGLFKELVKCSEHHQ